MLIFVPCLSTDLTFCLQLTQQRTFVMQLLTLNTFFSFSILWLTQNVQKYDECIRDFLLGIGEEKQHSARLTAWFHTPQNYFVEVYFSLDYFELLFFMTSSFTAFGINSPQFFSSMRNTSRNCNRQVLSPRPWSHLKPIVCCVMMEVLHEFTQIYLKWKNFWCALNFPSVCMVIKCQHNFYFINFILITYIIMITICLRYPESLIYRIHCFINLDIHRQ